MTYEIRALRKDEWTLARQLLIASELPVDDLHAEDAENFLAAVDGDRLVGTVAIEHLGTDSLLRSLAVDRVERRNGIGRKLVQAAEEKARRLGIYRICLLTNTAEHFFAAADYRRAPRETARDAIRNHAQFKSLCPASAAFMEKNIQPAVSAQRVLFLCTGNSARSVLAEALLNHFGGGKFVAFSAGSHPTGKVNPFAIETLKLHSVSIREPRSKSWDEFAGADSKPIDIVVTVCDNAAGEVCPIWPGHPLTVHWGVDDPAAAEGTHEQKLAAFQNAFAILKHRVEQLVALNIEPVDATLLKSALARIGKSVP